MNKDSVKTRRKVLLAGKIDLEKQIAQATEQRNALNQNIINMTARFNAHVTAIGECDYYLGLPEDVNDEINKDAVE
jgi:hypothetical protein